MTKTIIFIGPICSGKTTVAALLAKKLDMPQCSIDDVRFTYYKDNGFSEDTQREIREQEGFNGVYSYWKPFEADAAVRIVREYQHHIIDFGGGHSVYEDPLLFKKVSTALDAEPYIFLLLPSADQKESVQVLNERLLEVTTDPQVHAINEHFVTNPSNERLAKYIIYTNGKTPGETAEEIEKIVNN